MRTAIHFKPTNYEYREACERQAKIDADKAAFMAGGGKIVQVPTGLSGNAISYRLDNRGIPRPENASANNRFNRREGDA